MQPHLILASQSPRRRELLTQIGITYRVEVADIDETPRPHESPFELVQRLALEKAQAVWERSDKTLPVLGADTLGFVDDELLLKPLDFADAKRILKSLSNREHDILTAVALCSAQGQTVRLNHSRVWFRAITEAEIAAYWASGEPQDKAGAYGIQGRAAIFIERLEGSHSAVMGLPLFETAQLLQAHGISVLS
ncbi:MAG: nucleoside triphosphate pyrophosphatase [Thiofilum sp.]|uniref:Maf family protein n=1 Tax=Thiofilum sp. TaxID=2212733 RepID=UPI0025CBB67B|nr:nucleoside triphosphate pyrophosphatase [Thiofilum sp.]MBK8453646.1 septum formation inhibitor Maf [Thiofilum sp.]